MGIPDSSLLDLIEKLRNWVSWGGSDLSCLSEKFDMLNSGCKMCCECNRNLTEIAQQKYNCKSCGRWLCAKCVRGYDLVPNAESGNNGFGETTIRSCKFCSGANNNNSNRVLKYSEKVHPSASPQESPRQSPEPPSPCFSVESERISSPINTELNQGNHFERYLHDHDCGYYPQSMTRRMSSSGTLASSVSIHQSTIRSDEEEIEDSAKHFHRRSRTYCDNYSDIDSSSFSARHDTYNYNSVGSSPSDSPSRNDFTSSRVGLLVQKGQEKIPGSQHDGPFSQQSTAVLRKPEQGTDYAYNTAYFSDDLSIFWNQNENSQRPLDFENNGLIWFPPAPEDENDDAESNFFAYDDEDDDIGDSGAIFSSSSSLSNIFPTKEKQNEGNKEPLKAVIQGHFRALVSQLLQGEGIKLGKENDPEDWLDIVATIAWQAANFVRPDTSRGGSMDPGDYVKVKCVASGSPSESTLIKGVVCTKNIKHKRMTSQYKKPRLLLLAGALEYQKVPNQLASFDTLLQQENDHLKMIISKIEALRPNVLLVERSVASCAQQYLLAKEISLVLNVKRPLLERIARCTGAHITPSVDSLSKARVGHCDLFRLDKMVEDHETATNFQKKPSKTLMFFEGCPRRLGCTVLLKGTNRADLKKIKHAVQFAVFAAYHLSLETSFLADEGATLPKMIVKHSMDMPEIAAIDADISNSLPSSMCHSEADADLDSKKLGSLDSPSKHLDDHNFHSYTSTMVDYSSTENVLSDSCCSNLTSNLTARPDYLNNCNELEGDTLFSTRDLSQEELQETMVQEEREHGEVVDMTRDKVNEDEFSGEYFSATESNQSILVYFSSHCVSKGTVCERNRLLRIKFYGSFDKPLGRYLRDDLFDLTSCCQFCKEPADAHVLCFTHQQGNLTINVRRLPSVKLPGEKDGKIWMWHRCLRCPLVDGVPPATRRVVMSDAAWGLSFGKFLELSFSNHATANRVATCGHSLQRDCLRFYGYGSMVAFFRYSPIDILSVHLPPSVLEFGHNQEDWTRKEAGELFRKVETLYVEISDALDRLERSVTSHGMGNELSDTCEIHHNILELKDMLQRDRKDYHNVLLSTLETPLPGKMAVDILELNRLRRSLLIGSYVWDHRLYSLDSHIKRSRRFKGKQENESCPEVKEPSIDSFHKDRNVDNVSQQDNHRPLKLHEPDEVHMVGEPDDSLGPCTSEALTCHRDEEETHSDGEVVVNRALSECFPHRESNLSEKIDSAWTGTGTEQPHTKVEPLHTAQSSVLPAGSVRHSFPNDNPPFRRLMQPIRVHSFDSALRVQERIKKVLPSSLHLSTLRSFHASGEYKNMVRDPVSNVFQSYFQMLPWEAQRLNLILSATPSFISSCSHIAEGARLLLPQTHNGDRVIAVYDNEYSSIISYALSSKEHEDWVSGKSDLQDASLTAAREKSREDLATSSFNAWGSLDLDYINYASYMSEDATSSLGSLIRDPKKSSHFQISFGDDSLGAGGRVNFSVTCYFAKQFEALRKKCCSNEVDFVRSLSRCQRWRAQGGKSNVYFAKSLDERFIIKQVTKTELDSFEEFAPQYFKYLMDSLNPGGPTCLAKILGLYQVTIKYPKGGKETRIDVMIMENLFYNRKISRVYDLKGSERSRYNPDTTGTNKVMLDMNLLEALRTKPIFLGSRAKRRLERAVWNDTSFLASVDVMDYSLLVGVDDERKELVLGIIDFMRQYTWDKHLETWVKASGILGGPKNAAPTIVSPKQYKKRFRKAMTTYFLTLPEQWSS
ncbi:putative 1-phosphatidylinositol-3-phosphate 5-kinase FAB1C [Arachis stenosperma]|uniref:putative 1-phosphatidylinositol-3-phosphate 5-kinase FAB1C n=1 Tax=Arachis stenosperma TaxID=217475 RepID=UPI0025AD4B12|nr:putative 1-phosphatidylinositol-3-phosphate 5-kinase FAB1C [Arachis stenosperma]